MAMLRLLALVCVAGVANAVPMNDTWYLKSSVHIGVSGKEISQPGFNSHSWFPIALPATVLAGLLQNNVYEDPFYGMNLNSLPPDFAAEFNVSWWYRTDFKISAGSDRVHITFKGLNYRANVWCNGVQIGNETAIVGAFRYFSFDITSVANVGGANALAVEIFRPFDRVFPPQNLDTDLSITFVDWAPPPSDGTMGLWREVILETSGPVTVRYPSVNTTVSADLSTAYLDVLCELQNHGSTAVTGTLLGTIGAVGQFSATVTVPPGATQQVLVSHTSQPVLVVKNPQLWWPYQMGEPALYSLTLSFTPTGATQPSDTISNAFGMRQMTSELTSQGHRLYRVNGKPILIRGAGWAPQMFYQTTHERQMAEFSYVRDMGLNAIRLEGKMEDDHFFDLADQYGILTMPGWCCCDAWQHWPAWGPEQYAVSAESLRTQVKRLRIRASVLVFLYASDETAPTNVEAAYLAVFKEELWQNPVLASAAATTSPLSGPTGVKMSGPYSWVPPNYWLTDTSQLGGAFGFLTEGGPGEAPMTFESFARTVPEKEWWTSAQSMGTYWSFHCANPAGLFRNLRFFTPPLNARYGAGTSAQDYLQKSQVAIYEGMRAMYEGYSRNKYISTGVIQWMLNNAWPEMVWHLYDFYLNQGGSYFGAKKACEPVHIQYSYDNASIWVVNSLYVPTGALTATATVMTLGGTTLYTDTVSVPSVAADGAVAIMQLPSFSDQPQAYLLRLLLTNGQGEVSRNEYWLSPTPDVLDWSASTFYRTPCTSYANFTALTTLAAVSLTVSAVVGPAEGNENGPLYPLQATVTATNPTTTIAFFVRLRLLSGGQDIAPIMWTDNYFMLLGGETRVVNATFGGVDPTKVTVVWETFNNISGGQ